MPTSETDIVQQTPRRAYERLAYLAQLR